MADTQFEQFVKKFFDSFQSIWIGKNNETPCIKVYTKEKNYEFPITLAMDYRKKYEPGERLWNKYVKSYQAEFLGGSLSSWPELSSKHKRVWALLEKEVEFK